MSTPNTQSTALAVLPQAALARAVEPEVWRSLREMYDNPSDDSLGLVIDYCKARKLDVMKKPVHIVPVYSQRQKKMVETVWPSIQEVRTTAARTGLFAGMDETKYGETRNDKVGAVQMEYPDWAQITVYRMVGGARCAFTGPKVYWLEAYATKSRDDASPNSMWQKRPWGQLEKCAEAAALRRAFPEESSMTADEMFGRVLEDHGLNDDPIAAPAAAAPAAAASADQRAMMPKKRKGASGVAATPEPEKNVTSTGTAAVTAAPPTETTTTPPPPPTPAEAVTVDVEATETATETKPAEAPPAETKKEEAEVQEQRATTSRTPTAEWPKSVTGKILDIKDAPVRNNPKVTSVKVCLLGGGETTLAGKKIKLEDLGRIAFDPEKPELQEFAKAGETMLDFRIEEQPSTSNPGKMNRVIIACSISDF